MRFSMRKIIGCAVWLGAMALMLAKGWMTPMWIFAGITVLGLLIGAVSKDENASRSKREKGRNWLTPSGGADPQNEDHGKRAGFFPGYTAHARLYSDVYDRAEEAGERRTRAD